MRCAVGDASSPIYHNLIVVTLQQLNNNAASTSLFCCASRPFHHGRSLPDRRCPALDTPHQMSLPGPKNLRQRLPRWRLLCRCLLVQLLKLSLKQTTCRHVNTVSKAFPPSRSLVCFAETLDKKPTLTQITGHRPDIVLRVFPFGHLQIK